MEPDLTDVDPTRRRSLDAILEMAIIVALVASGRATNWPGGIRTHWRSPTFTAYWFDGTPSKELRLRETGDGNSPTHQF
jgi:hypothetical protein